MAELLIKAISATHVNPEKDQRGCYKLGMIVEIRPDGCVYGLSECLPTFFKIKLPLVPINNPILMRLMESQQVHNGFEDDGTTPRYDIVRRRRCWLKHIDIPQAAKDKLRDTGELIIKANAAYEGPYDYTWTQIKNYLWDDDTQSNIVDDIT
jgi:hypothetical protein